MFKRVLSVVMFILLLASILVLAFNIRSAKGETKTWYVDDDGGADFTSINLAINAANAGDTIYVYNGTYCEHIYIYKSLSLVGENKYGTIIDGSGYGPIVYIYWTSVNFSGFTIRNAGGGQPQWDCAFSLELATLCNVSDNIIRDGDCAIWLYDAHYNTIIENTISRGIELSSSHYNTIIGNTISNIGDCAIWLYDAHYNTIIENTISNSKVGIYLGSDDNTIIGNTVSDCSGDATYGIIVWGSNNRITDNIVTNVPYTGIRLNSPSEQPNQCTNNVVSGNVVSNASNGIEVSFKSSFNTLIGNNVANSGIGITISDYSNNNTLNSNVLTNNNLGISLGGFSENNTMDGNVITSNLYGIDIFDSSNTKLYNNNVTANTYSNIYIHSSSGNTICDNLISNSQNGLMFLYSSNNNVYHNNFVNNTEQVYSYDSVNVWDDDYPSGGNYWSDYTDIDVFSGPYQNITGSDGIGDSPYVIDENNQDTYPRVLPIGPILGDLNQDGIVNVLDAIQAASAFGSHAGDPGWNEQADINRDGVVNILDVIILGNNFGKH